MSVVRFGVSLEEDLQEALDEFVRVNNFPNRSRAIRYLIEKNLVERKWQCNNEVAGTVVLWYPTDSRDVSQRVNDVRNEFRNCVLGAQLYLLDSDNSLEVIAVKGPSYKLTELSDKLISVKGVHHGKLVMSRVD